MRYKIYGFLSNEYLGYADFEDSGIIVQNADGTPFGRAEKSGGTINVFNLNGDWVMYCPDPLMDPKYFYNSDHDCVAYWRI